MIRFTFLFWLLGFSALAQVQEITVEGQVLDALNRKGIKSSIRYKSYPTGGISGRFNDSTFSFTIFGSSKYQVTAEADGYIPLTMIVDPKESVNNKIQRNILLTSTSRAIILDHLIFEMGRAVINSKSYQGLDEVVAMMKDNTKVVIQLEGHTDNLGNAEKNMKLSQDRVEAVKKYLVSKGIDKNRIKTKAFGGTQPLSNERTEEAKALNRRVEMRVLKD
ncbi:MAG: OmpA family protein [Cyclobacteriaceae bacterium]|jgi:OOP family OmpA-OmpF porin|nr:OmpA family protein [Flammeovirgaceae bacterium]